MSYASLLNQKLIRKNISAFRISEISKIVTAECKIGKMSPPAFIIKNITFIILYILIIFIVKVRINNKIKNTFLMGHCLVIIS